MGVRFSVLGPLFVTTNAGDEVTLRSRHERAVLAMLLAEPGRVVNVDNLVEALWPQKAPASYVSNLQTYVSRLRERLAGTEIEHTGGGYRLRLDADSLDLLAYRRDIAAARAILAAGDPPGAVARFRRGLDLWRGRPFADVPVASLEPHIGQWEVERLSAVEDWLDAELASGEGRGDVLAELHRLVAEHPLRERLRGQLMIALSLAGRRADALSAYQDARDTLVDELGIEPGPQLRRLHRAVLRGEELAPPVPAAAQRAWAPVCQLPPALSGFVGRDALAARLAGLLAPSPSSSSPAPSSSPASLAGMAPAVLAVPVVALSGQPGVGKSALAVEVAHRSRAAFPDGQLYAHLAGASAAPRDPAAVLADLLRSLGAPESAIPQGLPALSAAYRAKVADRRVLIVLDEAADPAQVRPLIPGTPGSAVLVTSRQRLSGLIDARHVQVDPLTDAEAGALLAYAVGADRVAAERVPAGRIAAACGNLPLALRIAGTRLATRPWRLAALAERLEDERLRLTELAVGDQQVRAALALSVRALSASAREAFGLLGLPGPVSFAGWAVAALLGRLDAEAVIDELVEASLIEPVQPDAGEPRYRLHDLLRIYADELGGAGSRGALSVIEASPKSSELPGGCPDHVRGRWAAARLRLLAEAAARTRAAARRLPRTLTWYPGATGGSGEDDPTAWFTAELDFLTGAAAMAHAAGADRYAVEIAEGLAPFLWVRGRWTELRAVQRVARSAAERVGDQRAAARAEFIAGVLSLVCGDMADAAAGFAHSRAVFERLGDRHGLACVLSDQAVLSGHHNRFEESARDAHHAVELFRAEGDPIAAVLASPALSAALRGLGRSAEALEVDRTAVAQARRQGAAEIVVGRSLNSLAVTRLVRGQPRLAYAAAAEAVDRLRSVGDRYVLLAALRHLASAATGLGRRGEAVRLLQESHDLAVELGDRLWSTGLERDLAASWIGDGRAAAAVPVLRRCLQTYDDMNIRSAKATTLDMLARAYDALGDQAAARDARRGADGLADARSAALSKIILRLAESVTSGG